MSRNIFSKFHGVQMIESLSDPAVNSFTMFTRFLPRWETIVECRLETVTERDTDDASKSLENNVQQIHRATFIYGGGISLSSCTYTVNRVMAHAMCRQCRKLFGLEIVFLSRDTYRCFNSILRYVFRTFCLYKIILSI